MKEVRYLCSEQYNSTMINATISHNIFMVDDKRKHNLIL